MGVEQGCAAGAEPIEGAERHRLRQTVAEADDLGENPVRAPPKSSRSPTETYPLRPSISTTRPDIPAIRPSRRSGGISCNLARHAVPRCDRVVHLIETTVPRDIGFPMINRQVTKGLIRTPRE